MGKESDDGVPQEYPYFWSKGSSIDLPDFLTKYKPSMVQNDGTKPWIWVEGSKRNSDTYPSGAAAAVSEAAAVCEAAALLKEVTQRIEEIKNDDSIPMRSSKKTGAKSKKEVREKVQADAAEKLKEISIKHNYVCGKWLIFASADKVDAIWSRIATSLVSGALASTCAFLTKVATSPANETPHHQHLICLYIPNVYDKDSVTEVMKVLLRNHGVNLSGVKSDLYTGAGLDSKHPSGIPSTVWKNTSLLADSEIKDLKDAFFSELNAASTPAAKLEEKKDKPSIAAKKRPVPKKKTQEDDPFASEDEGDAQEAERKQKVQAKGKSRKRSQSSDMDVDDMDVDDMDVDADQSDKPKTKRIKSTR
ncbi:translation initiation factor eIF 4e-like domain-containing protein [Suillus clintonianus]|uniref:translation initiation factor eIF 4e-like domain-containing protein n=1 Tax=Suillus clintonianus TaxID=1904413 RepID=UPI001B868CCC|nr:translation initiation factor eIF 4e-like domain-containing protein [Suillus clintonianus]KAG2153302.1 translation initiation factor eIF 4e-like domain-containing protein [Suillus clintonianus]